MSNDDDNLLRKFALMLLNRGFSWNGEKTQIRLFELFLK
jgi:hypothetical protein